MPELPEVETVCRGLERAIAGARIVRLEQNRKDLRTPFPDNLVAQLAGRKVISVRRRAKYILMMLDKHEVLLLHLGMSGRMVIDRDGAGQAKKHDHLVFHLLKDKTPLVVRFNDPRRFGMCDLVAEAALPNHTLLCRLGIEPLERELTPAYLKKAFHNKKTTIKAALLDQSIVAGLGNIYVCEALFLAGISPLRQAGKCTNAQLEKLVPAIRKTLNAAIDAGGSSLRDYVQSDGESGYFQHQFTVYGKEGNACKGCDCDVTKTDGIQRIAQGGRSTFYCPVKQV